jgi:hypothetical protein
MKACPQTSTQSVYQHGESVRDRMFQLIQIMKTGEIADNWRLPEWVITHKAGLLDRLLSDEIIEEYTVFHDCSKSYCRIVDKDGRQHFPNHAELSYQVWLDAGGNREAATLMKMDMDIHLLQLEGVEEFSKRPQAITLLLAGLAEIKSNSEMFGGEDSLSYKIKYKHIDKRGRAICKKLFV